MTACTKYDGSTPKRSRGSSIAVATQDKFYIMCLNEIFPSPQLLVVLMSVYLPKYQAEVSTTLRCQLPPGAMDSPQPAIVVYSSETCKLQGLSSQLWQAHVISRPVRSRPISSRRPLLYCSIRAQYVVFCDKIISMVYPLFSCYSN